MKLKIDDKVRLIHGEGLYRTGSDYDLELRRLQSQRIYGKIVDVIYDGRNNNYDYVCVRFDNGQVHSMYAKRVEKVTSGEYQLMLFEI